MKFALIANQTKPGVGELQEGICAWLSGQHVETVLLDGCSFPRGELGGTDLARLDGADMVLVLGGDGTLLHAARVFSNLQIPLMGVNFGYLGFLTTLEKDSVYAGLQKVLQGEFVVEERMLLDVALERAGQRIGTYRALNDSVVSKRSLARMVDLEVGIDDCIVDHFSADGIIVATPTGSTAYSLSAGGPIVEPSLSAFLLTPVCAHNLYSRPMVVSAETVVTIRVVCSSSDVTLTLDGQLGIMLHEEDRVIVQRSADTARFVRLRDRGFYQILHDKLRRNIPRG